MKDMSGYFDDNEIREDRLKLHYERGGAPVRDSRIKSVCLGTLHVYDYKEFWCVPRWEMGLKKYIPSERQCPECTRYNNTDRPDETTEEKIDPLDEAFSLDWDMEEEEGEDE